MKMSAGPDIGERFKDGFLRQAERDGRYSAQKSEFHVIHAPEQGGELVYDVLEDDPNYLQGNQKISCGRSIVEEITAIDSDANGMHTPCYLRCLLHRSRPPHISGHSDTLPFRNAETTRYLFHALRLPTMYFQIADGSPATVYSHTNLKEAGAIGGFEFIAHVPTNQGDWAMALSHDATTNSTSAFLSVDGRIDSSALRDDLFSLREYAFHPVLLPCIMLAPTLRMAMERRRSIRERLVWIEKHVARISEGMALSSRNGEQTPEYADNSSNVEALFGLLNGCKKDQESRKGQYEYWNSFNDAIEEGFRYAECVLDIASNEQHGRAHNDLRKWKGLTWQRIRSIMARDEDHNNRVDNVSHTLYTLNQQRDIRIQSHIARASQRDSEDMKFIAVLGSIFLPTSLVATILNVPDFQFLHGAALFGAYIAISLPLVALVVVLCIARKYRTVWGIRQLQSVLIGSSQQLGKRTSI